MIEERRKAFEALLAVVASDHVLLSSPFLLAFMGEGAREHLAASCSTSRVDDGIIVLSQDPLIQASVRPLPDPASSTPSTQRGDAGASRAAWDDEETFRRAGESSSPFRAFGTSPSQGGTGGEVRRDSSDSGTGFLSKSLVRLKSPPNSAKICAGPP